MLSIIGGAALAELPGFHVSEERQIETPYGDPSAALKFVTDGQTTAIFLARHGDDRSIPPHKINYRANIWALRDAGADAVLSVSAVGGIHPDAAPRALVVPDQLVDYTWGRPHTFYDGPELNHIDFTEPYAAGVRTRVLTAGARASIDLIDTGVYGATQGPRLETAAEIERLRRDGCTLVGMTGMPEASLARELELQYACCALVVNWAAGCSEELIDMDTILQNVVSMEGKITTLITAMLRE